jgi:hypothetical protein
MNGSNDAIQQALKMLAGMVSGYSGSPGMTSGGGPASADGAWGGGAMGAAANAAAQNYNSGGAGGSGGGTISAASGSGAIPPELSQILNLMMERMRFQENLFRSVTNQAYQGLPKYAQWTGSNGGASGAIGPGV